jgi:hypothetical protein
VPALKEHVVLVSMPIYQWERDRSSETLIFDYHIRLGSGAEPSEPQAVICN